MNMSYSSDDPQGRSESEPRLPPPPPWAGAAVRLLQGVVYHDDNSAQWETLLSNVSAVTDYFAKLGLLLVVDEADGMAYLRQAEEEDSGPDYEPVPRLFRRTPLGYDATVLCMLLRDELRRFEEEDVQNERCVMAQMDLLAVWQAFFPELTDAVRLNRSLTAALRKLEDLKFVRQFEKEPPAWEIRRIIKARLPLEDLEQLRSSLVEAARQRGADGTSSDEDAGAGAADETAAGGEQAAVGEQNE